MPVLYFKNLFLILSGKIAVSGWKSLHFIGWLFAGPGVILYYGMKDIILIFKVAGKNHDVTTAQEKVLNKVSDDNVIYINRYEALKTGI